MLRKSGQNILLVSSVVLMFVLVSQIWFGGYFMPGAGENFLTKFYNTFIHPIVSLFDKDEEPNFSENLQQLMKPDKIVFNAMGNRIVFDDNTEGFEEMKKLSSDIMRKGMNGEYEQRSREVIDEETYLNALRGQSIYVDYGKNYDFRLLSLAISEDETNRFSEDIGVVQGYVIGFQEGVMDDISIYLADRETKTYYRYMLAADQTGILNELGTIVKGKEDIDISYSYELNFHKQQEGSKVLFDPMVLMDLAPVKRPSLQNLSQEKVQEILEESSADSILEAFSISNKTMRWYTDLSGARVFVENNATLTLHPNGLLVYQVVPGHNGLDFTGNGGRSNYDICLATADCVDFTTQICSKITPSFLERLQISSHLTESAAKDGTYKICFDYSIGGVPIRHKTEGGYAHAIEIEVKNGYLISYRQYIKNYEISEEMLELKPMINAADSLVDTHYTENNPLHIKATNPCYIEDDEGNIKLVWKAMVNDAEVIIE